MSILTGPEIVKRIRDGSIIIDPFDPSAVQPNSIDLRLASALSVYRVPILDAMRDNPTTDFEISSEGIVLSPGNLYLGSTVERTWAKDLVPMIETRSSLARLGFSSHLSAGWGDTNFDGVWVLEITVVHPLRIYPNMRVCQIAFAEAVGDIMPYKGRYQGQRGPVASRLWKDTING